MTHLRQSSCRVWGPTLVTILSRMARPHSPHSVILSSPTVIKSVIVKLDGYLLSFFSHKIFFSAVYFFSCSIFLLWYFLANSRLTSALLAPPGDTEPRPPPGPGPATAATVTPAANQSSARPILASHWSRAASWTAAVWTGVSGLSQWRYILLISLNILLVPAWSGLGVCFSVINYLPKIIHPGLVLLTKQWHCTPRYTHQGSFICLIFNYLKLFETSLSLQNIDQNPQS